MNCHCKQTSNTHKYIHKYAPQNGYKRTISPACKRPAYFTASVFCFIKKKKKKKKECHDFYIKNNNNNTTTTNPNNLLLLFKKLFHTTKYENVFIVSLELLRSRKTATRFLSLSCVVLFFFLHPIIKKAKTFYYTGPSMSVSLSYTASEYDLKHTLFIKIWQQH